MPENPQSPRGTLLLDSSPRSIEKAAALLKRGGLVAFPTETVYGLGANASDSAAVQKIFRAKGRPPDNPLIVHIAAIDQLRQVALCIPPEALLLAGRFWPGPLSLVLQRSSLIAAEVSAGLSTVAVRMPDHALALSLIRAAEVPVAAPSANLAGRPSPTSYRHVLEDLGGRVDAVIAGGNCRIGVESTVLDLTTPRPCILRPGGVTREELEKVLNCRVAVAGIKLCVNAPSSPGMKYRHYSPRAPLILITGHPRRRRRLCNELAAHYRGKGLHVGLLNQSYGDWPTGGQDAGLIAFNLYRALRLMDLSRVDLILAEGTETAGLGLAVMNRLRKAAARVLKV